MKPERDWEFDLKEVSFAPGEWLFQENERSFHFYVLLDGDVEVFKSQPHGDPVLIATVTAPTSIGEFAMIDQQPRSASARAKTTVRATMISEAAYKQLLSELPDWAMSVMRALVERLRQTNEVLKRHKETSIAVVKDVQSLEFDTANSAQAMRSSHEDSKIFGDAPFLLDPED